MAFSIKELAISLNPEDEGNNGWVVVIACGSRSAQAKDVNCTGTETRLDPFDCIQGLKTKDDLNALQLAMDALRTRLAYLKGPDTDKTDSPK